MICVFNMMIYMLVVMFYMLSMMTYMRPKLIFMVTMLICTLTMMICSPFSRTPSSHAKRWVYHTRSAFRLFEHSTIFSAPCDDIGSH